jgi:hypothetical protein
MFGEQTKLRARPSIERVSRSPGSVIVIRGDTNDGLCATMHIERRLNAKRRFEAGT